MSKKSGIIKWFSRLMGYGYINPDDDDKDGVPPQSVTDDGGKSKPLEENATGSGPREQDKKS